MQGFHKGISNITHLKTNQPGLHSLTQRTFYPRLQGGQADRPGPERLGRGRTSRCCPLQALSRRAARKPAEAGAPGLSQASVRLAQGGRRVVPSTVGELSWAGASAFTCLIQYLTLQGDVDPFYR